MTSEVQNAYMAARLEPTNAGDNEPATCNSSQIDIETLIEAAIQAEIYRQLEEVSHFEGKKVW